MFGVLLVCFFFDKGMCESWDLTRWWEKSFHRNDQTFHLTYFKMLRPVAEY
jgi:hypothetical protein